MLEEGAQTGQEAEAQNCSDPRGDAVRTRGAARGRWDWAAAGRLLWERRSETVTRAHIRELLCHTCVRTSLKMSCVTEVLGVKLNPFVHLFSPKVSEIKEECRKKDSTGWPGSLRKQMRGRDRSSAQSHPDPTWPGRDSSPGRAGDLLRCRGLQSKHKTILWV